MSDAKLQADHEVTVDNANGGVDTYHPDHAYTTQSGFLVLVYKDDHERTRGHDKFPVERVYRWRQSWSEEVRADLAGEKTAARTVTGP